MPVEKYKTEKCRVLRYNKRTKELDVDFMGYGIRLYNIDKEIQDIVNVKYRGEIGASNFQYRL